MLPNLSDRINTCLCLIYLLFVSDAYYSSAPTYIYIFIYTREIPNPSHLPTFHPHSKTLSIIIEACCSHNASQPTPPNPSDPIDIPFSSHTYYYSAPKYSLLLLPSYYYPEPSLPPWFNPTYKIHFNPIRPCCYYYASLLTPPNLSPRI